MNKIKNSVRKQLLLAGSLLMCIVTYGGIPSKLPGMLKAMVGTQNTYVYSPNTPILIEEVSSQNHRVIAIESHGIKKYGDSFYTYTFAFTFESYNGTQRVVDNLNGMQDHTPQDLDMYMCYDTDIPNIIINQVSYKSNGEVIIGDYITKYGNLHLGFNNSFQIKGEPYQQVVVLPLMGSSEKYKFLYKSYNKNSGSLSSIISKSAPVTAGDRVYFSADKNGEGVDIAVFVKNGYYFSTLTTRYEGKDSEGEYDVYSFEMPLTDEIYVFSYVNSTAVNYDGESRTYKYYSSNYKLFTPKVYLKPSCSFVNATEYSSTLFVLNDATGIKIQNTTGCPIRVSRKDNGSYTVISNSLASNAEVGIDISNLNKLTICLESGLSGSVGSTPAAGKVEKTYSITRLKALNFNDNNEPILYKVSNNNGVCTNTADVTIKNNESDWDYPYSGYRFTIQKNNETAKDYTLERTIKFNNLQPNTTLKLVRSYSVGSGNVKKELVKTITIADKYGTNYSVNTTLDKNIIGCENNDKTAATITVNATGGFSPYTYSTTGNGVQNGNVFKYKTAGGKTITVTDNYGCKVSKTQNIAFTSISISVGTDGVKHITGCLNNAATAGSITFSAQNGSEPYTYSTTGNGIQNGNVFKYQTAGDKTITVTDKNGCQASVKKEIKLNNKLTLDVIPEDPQNGYYIKCNGGTNNLKLVIGGGNGNENGNDYTLEYEDKKINNVSNNKVVPLPKGTHSIKISDIKGCSKETSITLTEPDKITFTTSPKDVICFGTMGSIEVKNVSGGVGGYKYIIENSLGQTSTQDGNFFSVAKVTYTIKVKDANDFIEPHSGIGVRQPEKELKYTVTPVNFTTTTSSDARIDVTSSGGWGGYTIVVKDNNGATISNNTGLQPGEYTVTVTDEKGCVFNDNNKYTIARPEKDLSLSVSAPKIKCHGASTGEITVSADGGWPNNNNYKYKYTLKNIRTNKVLYDKTKGGETITFPNLPSDTYKVTVEDKMGVTHDTTITIEQPDAALSASSKTDNVQCNGGNDGKITVTVTGGTHGTRGYTLLFVGDKDGKTYPDDNGVIVVGGLIVDSYKYTITDANGCTTDTLTSKVDEPTALVLSADAVGELHNGFNIPCADETGEIVVSAKGGTAGYQFSIDGGPFTAQYGKDAKHTFSGVEGGKHKITVKDGHGCVPKPEEVELTKPEPIIITKIDLTQPLCNGDSDGEMTIYAKGGVPDQNDAYNFSLDGNSASEKAQHTFTGLAAKDNYHVVVTDANECFVEKDIDLGQPAKLEASVSNVKNNLCNGDKLGIITFAVNGGIAPYGYSLNGKDKVAFSNDMAISGLPSLPNKNKHSIVVSDAHGCKADAISQEIEQPDPITAKTILNDYNGNNIRCFGDADDARIEISGGVGNYTTTLGDRTLTGKDVQFVGLKKGNYSYKVVDGNDCSETFDFEMRQPDNLMLTYIDYTDAKCHNGTNGTMTAKVIGGVRSYTYNVTNSNGAEINKLTTDADNYNYSSFAAGEYTFKVTDANSCVISNPFTIGQPDPLTVSVSTLKDVVCKGTETGEVSATAKGGTSPYSYSWNKGMTGQSIQNLPAGEYSVMVTDANNCQSEVDENGVKAQTTIDEPASALTMLEPVYANPTCSYNKDGEITINVSGGWGGYEYTLNGVSYGSNKIEGLDEGTYTAKVKDAGGCEVSTNDITLKKPEALSFENKIGTIICKGGATDVTITSASGGTGCNYSYSIDGGNTWQTGTTFANVVSGSYILRMKDGNECLATDKEITVTEPESLVLKEDVRHNYNGSTHKANGKITVTPQGGVMPYSYQWKDTTVTSQELDNIGFGIYTIIVTDSLGCVKTGTYYINDNNPTPEVVDAICPEGTEGSIRFGDTVKCTKVEWYNARTEELLPQSGTKTITGLPKGIYKAKLFNDTQVTYIYAEVKAPDSLKYATSQRNIDCHGDNTGMASVSFTGGVVPVSVVWKNQSDDEISHSQTIENLIKGKYTAYISDAKNCQSSSQALEFDITEPAEAFVLAESAHNDVKCHGNNDAVVGLSVSGNQGAVTYFQDEAAIPSNTANSLYAGAYTFYAVDEKNCQTQPLNVTVSQPDPLSSSVKTIMPIKCAAETGSVEVEAEGGTAPYSYKVLEQTEFRLSPVFDGLTTADYKFVVKDNNNCHDTASYLLTEPEQLVITGSKLKDEYCGHSDGTISVDVEGGTGGYDIRWSDYQTGEMASGLPAGSYMVSVYDENRCLATETYDIKDIPAPVISIKSIDSTKCYGSADGVAELNVSLGTGAIAYHWETETTGVPYSGKLKAGQQSVVAVDEIGCADTAQFTMPQPDSMKIEIAVANPLCFNDNSGELTATVSNYKMGLSYKWDNGVAGSENRGLYAGTYGVSVTNANGCVAKKSATLVYPAKITIKKLAIADTKCDQPNGSVTVTATGGTGVLKYGVNMGAVAAANKIEGLLSGNHKLTVVDDNQCSIDTTVHVGANVPPVLVINTRDDVKCHGESNGKVSVGVEGGRTPFSYSWDSGDRTTMSAKNGLGVGSHKVYVFDGFGCSDTLDFAIEEPYVLEIYESGSTDPVCYGYSNGQIVAGVMGGTAPYTYQWGDRQSTAKATGLAAGTHYVNVTDKNGCKAKRYFTLSNPQPVVVDIPEVISICSNQTADIDAGHEGSFHYWSSANGFESVAQNISVSKKGTYVVTVTTPDGCIGRDSTYVNVSEKEINSNFLLQSDAYVGDTIVMIEISWPIPESIEWSCPEGMTVISDSGDEIEMVATKEGVYDVGLTTYNDICTEQTFKSIVVNPVAQKPAPRKLMAQKIIKEVKVYPNPAAGPFNLEIELSEEHDVTIEIVHMSGTLQKKRHMKGDRRYVLNFSNADLNAGINTITVIAGDEIVTKKLVIIR